MQAFSYLGAHHVTPPQHVFLVNAGESHTGEAATAHGYVYRTLYPTAALMAEITGNPSCPHFTQAVVHDARLPVLLDAFHRAVAARAGSLAVDTQLVELLEHVTARYSTRSHAVERTRRERRAVRQG